MKIMYALSFDIDTNIASDIYNPSAYNIIYKHIEDIMKNHHFRRRQGSVYFGDDDIRMQDCYEAVRDLAMNVKGFKESVRDFQMLQILEESELNYMLDWFEYQGN